MTSKTPEAERTIAAVSARFFLIQPDGSIRTRNDYNRMLEFAFQSQQTALNRAARAENVRVWDKVMSRFVADPAAIRVLSGAQKWCE